MVIIELVLYGLVIPESKLEVVRCETALRNMYSRGMIEMIYVIV